MTDKNQTFATGVVRPKTTALFFDKLWVPEFLLNPHWSSLPKETLEIFIGDPITSNKYHLAYGENSGDAWWYKYENDKLVVDNEHRSFLEYHEAIYRDDHDTQGDSYPFGGAYTYSTKYRDEALHEISKLYEKKGIPLVPVYHNPNEFDRVTGIETQGLEVCLDFVKTPIEQTLKWEQVLELRKDKKAQQKLTRLRRWINTDFEFTSHSKAIDELTKRLDNYEWALKKHGIQTAVGGMTSILSLAGSSTISLVSGNTYASLAAGLTVGAGVIAWVGKRMIDKMELSRTEVAYIHEVKKLVK